jgi:sacsin
MSHTNNVFEEVIEQLHLAVVSWTNQTTTPLTLAKFEEMIKGIYKHLYYAPNGFVRKMLQSKGLTQWIWQGSGFTSPEKVALESPFPKTINIHPYLFRLPNELFKVKEFLLSHGVKKQFTVDNLLDMLRNIKAKHDDEKRPLEDVMQDLDQCRAVLEWIVRSGGELSEKRRCKLLIPVQTESDKLQLEPCNTCTYCDREFLRRGVSEHEISIQFHLIHKAIPDDLASHLGVPRLSSCLAGAKEVVIKYKKAGQYEPLTTRLRNILQQYKEGVAIFKEIIQNADDARASKVCFVVDWRENPREKLLTEELAKCQGPALWAYNDAMFSEEDFENINKLAGETKKEDLDKVGRFGLGFNSVYHLTDVPSFLSGEHLVIFDPNMNHISKLIDGKMRSGGLMLSLVEHKHALSAFPHQFSPYNQLFGCDMTGAGTFHFKGTLFRLPFRTAVQAQESEISKEPYTRDNVNNLIKSLKESASTLLLFAQNVKEVRVFEISKNSNPEKSLERPIISITKSVETITKYTNITEGTILQNSSTWLLNSRRSGVKYPSDAPHSTEWLKMDVSMVKSDLSEVSEDRQEEDTWIVNSCTGSGSSLEVAQSADGKKNAVVPVTGIAAKMTISSAQGAKIFPVIGEVFCFMPLSIESGFPVHVNGSFSVYSNRRRLWEEGVGEHQSLRPFEAKWNEALMEDSLVQTYLQLLQILTSYNDKQYEFHSLWPNLTKVNYPKAWKPFLYSFFNKIIEEELPLFYCNGEWRKLNDCLILDPKLNKVADCVTIMNQLGENVLLLPQDFMEAFKCSGKEAFIKCHMLTEDRFLRDFFFPRVLQILNQLRNSVLVHILDRRLSKHRNYDDLLRTYPCFNCSKDETRLRKPSELVHPKGKAACLFSEEEGRFPLDDLFLEKERAMMLEELGMAIDFLPWRALCERAEWVSDHCDVKKTALLIQFMNQIPPVCEITADETRSLRAAQFLPILPKPKDYPFPWKSDKYRTMHLAAAENLYPERHKYLVGSSHLILDESSNSSSVPNKSLRKILGFSSKQPELSDVIAQLDQVIQWSHLATREDKESACSTIYKFLQHVATIENYKSKLRKHLDCRQWMLVKGQMVDSKLVAKNWKKEDGSPYLFSLPLAYSTKFKGLINWYGIKDNFGQEDFITAISKLREDTEGEKLLDDQIRTLIVLLEDLFNLPNTMLVDEIALPIPSSDCQLYNADELTINDTPWLETDGMNKLVHEKVPAILAYRCGAKDLRTADLTRCSQPIGQPFGQHEKLTDRLKNILAAYPSDEGILKELLQNADDAKATEIHFVFDPRTHGTKHVLSSNWKDLQGPAICVYNDKPFSKEDIEGIQKLGVGSKVDDPMKTGQYGIGFNAVYHLTDCPYFISNGEDICVSDPHTAYVPGASERHPGRLFPQLDEKFRRNYQDVLSSFLGNLFDLKESTMFRFPLRDNAKLPSKISTVQWNERKVKELFGVFRASAKDMLLFLNNVTKISVSVIKDGELETYSVMCEVSDKAKRTEFFEKIRACSLVPTQEITWQQIHYVMKISDTKNVKKDWLVTQSLGHGNGESDSQVPNGTSMGLLPRAGIAILLPSTEPPFRHSIFCILPLPVSTKFPVHINGHFALDSARRNLWHDPNSSDERVVWNNFMKRQVIARAYASAICHAREYILGYQAESGTFSSKKETEDGLRWYHQLFPSIKNLDTEWKPIGEALYKSFVPMFPVLPVAMSAPQWKKPLAENLSEAKTEPDETPVTVTWCKVSDAYFCSSEMSWLLEKTLLDMGFPLLSHTPWKIHESFKAVERYQDVSPERVREFLLSHGKIKDNLPKEVNDTVLHHVNNVHELTKYCAKAEDFFENLEGVPLLLQQDGILRCFCRDAIVFCSRFNQLLPSKSDLFLNELLRFLYASTMKKCSNVMREFLISDLAKFQALFFPSTWINRVSHQPWNPREDDNEFPSQEWLKLLWEFIDAIAKSQSDGTNSGENESKTSSILNEIMSWHIFPTTHNCLVPVSMGKTVLNVSTYLNSDSTQDKIIRGLLVKLGCPQLNHTILISSSSRSSNPTGATAVRKHYLAKVQSTEDVLGLLDQTLNGDTKKDATLENNEIERLLVFLQSDFSRLACPLLRNLPFYETISCTYTRLPDGYAVFEVPDDVPGDDLHVLSYVTSSIFLRQAPKLADLYRYIGIKQASSVDFYISVVLKHFNHLTPNGKVNHLKFVRDHLLHEHYSGYKGLLSVMKQLSFIPGHVGELRPAKEFYDPDNEIFEKFIPNEKFPPKPFDSTEWKEFLKKIGLQCDVTMEHFLKFSKQLEKEARNLSHPTSSEAKKILQKSSILVSHLFQNESLRKTAFLSQISKIKFVPAAKIIRLYLDVHPSHTEPILTCFSGSVIARHTALVWSSASLIATSAFPNSRDDLINMLGIHTNPPHELVISHVKNIVGRFPAMRNKEIPSALQPTLLDVTTKIYSYFKDLCGPGPRSNCTAECKFTSNALCNVPVILVDQHTFVCGSQLAFSGVWNNIKPYMFNIPRHLQHFEHFLKCLGAQERPTPLQYSSVLETIKRSCGDNQMHPAEILAAVEATKGLFICLSKDKKRSQTRVGSAPIAAQSLANVRTLYLPTEDNYLIPSCEVFVNDTMEKKERLKDYWKELLIDLTMRNQERPAKLVELLPSHLKVKKLSSILNEELSPSCIDKKCILDQDPSTLSCDFITRYRDIMCSREFSEALIRLYKVQEDTPNIPEQVENDLRSLENGVKVSCMQTIEVRLVKIATVEPVSDSKKEVPTFYHKIPGGFCILIKHGGEGNSGILHERLSSFISQITGQHIGEACWRYLMMILGVKDPCEISKTLDDARVTRFIRSISREPNPGDQIPEWFHYLLKNDINYHLREGEWVGYEVREEDEDNEAVYVYAKIIEQTSQGMCFFTELYSWLPSIYFLVFD